MFKMAAILRGLRVFVLVNSFIFCFSDCSHSHLFNYVRLNYFSNSYTELYTTVYISLTMVDTSPGVRTIT